MATYSPAEQQVLELAQAGLTNRQIAAVLGRALSTVKNQLNTAYKRADVVNRDELRAACAAGTLGVPSALPRPDTYRAFGR